LLDPLEPIKSFVFSLRLRATSKKSHTLSEAKDLHWFVFKDNADALLGSASTTLMGRSLSGPGLALAKQPVSGWPTTHS
jgi:hypothetical protein